MTQNKQRGRPSKYTGDKDIVPKVYEFIEECKEKEILPSKAGLGLHLGVTKETIHSWCNNHPEFLSAIKKVEQFQEQMLMNESFMNGKNATMAIFLLKNNHGYKDKTEVDTTANVIWKEERYGEE